MKLTKKQIKGLNNFRSKTGIIYKVLEDRIKLFSNVIIFGSYIREIESLGFYVTEISYEHVKKQFNFEFLPKGKNVYMKNYRVKIINNCCSNCGIKLKIK